MTQENSVSFKVFLQSGDPNAKAEVRRFGIDRDVVSNFSYLTEKLQAVFSALHGKVFDVLWKDNDGDDVLISTDDELMIALTEMQGDVRKLYVTIKGDGVRDHPSKRSGKSHPGVVCDECDNNIVGYRYKCLECNNYDLCSDCEYKSLHPEHFMIRLPVPVSWRPHFGRRLAHHLSKSARKCGGSCSADEAMGQSSEGEGCPFVHGHPHGRRRMHGHHRPMAWLDALSAIIGDWMPPADYENQAAGGSGANASGEKAKAPEGAASNGQAQAASEASPSKNEGQSSADAAAAAAEDANMQYLMKVGKRVASLLDPFGIDVDVKVEKNKVPEKTEGNAAEEKTKKNVAFADNVTANDKAPVKQGEEAKKESASPETASERETPEKDGWTVVEDVATGQEIPAASGPSAVKEEPTAPPKPLPAVPTATAYATTSAGTYTKPAFPVYYPPPPSFTAMAPTFPTLNPAPAPWVPVPPPPAPFPLGMFTSYPKPPQPHPHAPTPPQQQVQAQNPHQQQQQQQQMQGQQGPQAHHPDARINQAVETMMSMGFGNEGGWLAQLVEMKDGDIDKVLDALQPVKKD